MAAQQVGALLLVFLVAGNLLVGHHQLAGAAASDSSSPAPPLALEAPTTTEEPEAVDPYLEDLCIIENSTEAYRVNTEWTEEACDQKCRCVFRSTPLDDTREVLLLKTINMNSSSELTEIRCSMPPKCGPLEARLHQASRCARPLLAFTNGEPCSCPRLYCADSLGPYLNAMRSTSTAGLLLSSSTTTNQPLAATTAAAPASTATPVPTTATSGATQRPPAPATVGPSILQPIKSATATTTTTQRPGSPMGGLPRASTSSELPASTVAPATEAPATTTRPTNKPSILQPVKNTNTAAPVTEAPAATSTAASATITTTTTTSTTSTTSDSNSSPPDNSILVPAVGTATTATSTQRPTPDLQAGCAKKSLDDFEATFEECQVSCRCENNKLKCGSTSQEATLVPSQSIDMEPLPWTQQIQSRVNVQKYAWHLLVGFVTMSVMFIIVLFMYMKKSTFVMTSLAAQTGYDNASYNSRLVSYYANQPHVLMVDETNQNFNNAAIIARQKNLEVDQASPLHPQNRRLGEIHHPSGRQHLI